jgi:hypothetical protein
VKLDFKTTGDDDRVEMKVGDGLAFEMSWEVERRRDDEAGIQFLI